jgi:hypothetical protein
LCFLCEERNPRRYNLPLYAALTGPYDKNCQKNLKHTLSNVVKTVNYVRGQTIIHCLFKAFCEEIGSLHTNLHFHIEVRQLSRGQMFSRVYKLCEEINNSVSEKPREQLSS